MISTTTSDTPTRLADLLREEEGLASLLKPHPEALKDLVASLMGADASSIGPGWRREATWALARRWEEAACSEQDLELVVEVLARLALSDQDPGVAALAAQAVADFCGEEFAPAVQATETGSFDLGPALRRARTVELIVEAAGEEDGGPVADAAREVLATILVAWKYGNSGTQERLREVVVKVASPQGFHRLVTRGAAALEAAAAGATAAGPVSVFVDGFGRRIAEVLRPADLEESRAELGEIALAWVGIRLGETEDHRPCWLHAPLLCGEERSFATFELIEGDQVAEGAILGVVEEIELAQGALLGESLKRSAVRARGETRGAFLQLAAALSARETAGTLASDRAGELREAIEAGLGER